MKKIHPAELLQATWAQFLQEKGHRVHMPEGVDEAITSYHAEHNSFRWLLYVAQGRVKKLTPSEGRQLAGQIEAARELGQKPFVVVHFEVPDPKLIITPAEKVLNAGRVNSARGGIPWFD